MTVRQSLLLIVVLLALFSATRADDGEAVARGECGGKSLANARFVFHRAWFEKADDLFSAYVDTCPGDALAYGYAAMIDMLLYRDNTDNVDRARELASTHVDEAMVKALAEFAEGDLDKAEVELRRYVEEHPEDAFAQHVLGFTLNDQGEPDAGVAVLRQLLVADPDYFPALNHLAYGLASTGKQDEALEAADAFVAADPENPSAWDTRADLLSQVGRDEEAIASLARSLLLEPRFAYGWRHLGKILEARGEDAAASAAFRNAVNAAELYGPEFIESLPK